jgi:hypothetical protein
LGVFQGRGIMCDAIALTCIVLFFQILIYKIGCMQGEKTAYKRFERICNECGNSCKKCNSSEKSNS